MSESSQKATMPGGVVSPRVDRPDVEHGPLPRRVPQWLDTGASFAWRFLLVAAALYVVVLVLD